MADFLENSINKIAPSKEISILTTVPFEIDSSGFNLYLSDLNSNFRRKEIFVWLAVTSSADPDEITVNLECILNSNKTINTVFTLTSQFNWVPCRAVRILSGTDPSATFVVGVGN
jgi:hypothetical protein